MLVDRVINEIKRRRERVLTGDVNCIPSPFTRFREDYVGIEQGCYYLISGNTKAGKSQITSNLFVYEPLFYAYNNPDKVHLKIFYFPLEETPEAITMRFMSHLLMRLSEGKVRISTSDLKSVNETKPLNEDVIKLLESEEYNNILKFFEDTVIFGESRNPTGIYKEVNAYANINGISHKKTIEIINKETGEKTEREVFDYYEPFDPKEYVLIVTDHVSMLESELGKDLRQTINKFSEYMVYFRNRCGYSPVVIQQQSTETSNLEAFKNNKIRPTKAGLADSKNTGNDCTMMLGITNPHSFEVSNYLGYDITKLKGSIRFLEVVLNRNGQSNGIIGLYFDGTTCSFKEMPLPNDSTGIESVYKYIDSLVSKTKKLFYLFKKKTKTNG